MRTLDRHIYEGSHQQGASYAKRDSSGGKEDLIQGHGYNSYVPPRMEI